MRWLALLLGLIRIAGSDTGGGRGAGDRETESVVSPRFLGFEEIVFLSGLGHRWFWPRLGGTEETGKGGNVQIVVTHNEQDFCKVIKLLVLLTTSCDDFKVSLTEEENFDDPSRAKSSEFDL